MKLLKLSVLALGVFCGVAFAEQMPQPNAEDVRMATVHYDSNNVTEIFVKPGIFTQIVLEDGEQHEVHALGDEEAWHFAYYKNYLFVKPKQTLGTTNLSVVTNKRNYMFKVNYVADNNATDMYQVRFIYPEAIDQAEQEAKNKQALENAFDKGKTTKTYNLDYTMRVRGNRTIAPVNAYDDGNFTYFKFAGNVDLPAIYAVDVSDTKYGQEILVNYTVQGIGNDTLVMHKVHGMWRLRLGDTVIDVYNNGLNGYGVLNQTGTISSEVERIELGGEIE